uniref:Uncharacterized protein n=1 Tax=Oryza nivara TaxID=4536 RepID=A0A679BDW3_ORYNI|nr:hypothetical protein [Oryza sativa f. spontanea]BBF89841.1 hypothetical protein [Oryza sativa f. spontanea]
MVQVDRLCLGKIVVKVQAWELGSSSKEGSARSESITSPAGVVLFLAGVTVHGAAVLVARLTAGASTVAIAALSTTGKRGIGMKREKTRR